MKALEKDRERRYASPNAMVDDIERFLRDEPIYARPPSLFYRIRKFTQRNRVVVIAAASVFLAISLDLALAISGFLTARKQLAVVAAK